MNNSALAVGITISATGGAQTAANLNQVQTAVTGASTAAQASNRQFAEMAVAMRSAETAAAAINARLASASAIYDNQVARLTLSTRAYRAYQLQLDGLHPSQIRHIQDLEAVQAATAHTGQSMSGLSSVMGAFGVTLGLVGLAGLAKDILDTNRSMESLRAQLLALTGSADQAQQTFDFITQFAVNTPFEIQGLTKAFITLQNYGLTPTTEVMQAITDQSAKLGGRTETLQGITLALGQAWGKGKLQGQEILQMVDQGVPVWDLLAKVTGKNVAELQKMSENGEITRDVIDKLIKKMGDMATGANAAAMDTLNGKISNLADAWHQFEDALLQSKAEGVIKDIVSSITDTLNILTNQLGSTIDNQIAHAKARIDTFNSMGAVGGFISDLSGYDINTEKNKLDALNRIKQTQVETAALKAKTDEIKKANDMQVVSSDTTKKGAAELAKLTDTNNKLTLSNHDYVKQQLVSQGVEGDALIKAMALSDANDKLTASHKTLSKETSSAVKAAQSKAALASSYTSQVNTLLKSIALEGDATAKTAMQYEVEKGALNGLDDTKKRYLITQTTLLQTKQAETKANESAKSEMESLNDKYSQLTLSAREYYALSLANKGIAPKQQGPLLAQFDKNAGLEAASKSHADATQSLENYNKSLEQAKMQTSDLGAVTKAVFDGALGGISAVAGAFGTMVDAIGKNTEALTELHAKQIENDNYVPDLSKGTDEYNKQLKFKTDNAALYAKHEAELNNKNLKDQLAGASQIAGAASKMFSEKSAAAKAFHGVEVALSVARLAMDAVEMASTLAKIPVNIAAGASAMFAALGPFGFAAVAAMMATMAGLGFAGGSSVQAPPKSSPDTGTVLGDKTASSQSVDKTYQLLKDIHASEYVELRGINQGVSDLQAAITNTVTRVFQTGGLDLSNRGINLSSPDFKFNPLSLLGGLGGIFTNFLFSGGYRSVTERGISTPEQQLSNVGQNGFQAQQYNVVKTRTWDLFSDSTRYDTVMTTLDSKVTDSMTRIFSATGEVMTSLAKSFGGNLQDKVNQYVIPALRIDLTGLNADDAAKKLNGVISTALDTMATSVFGDIIGQYQKLGEGMLETAVRIVSEVAVVKDAFAQAGVTLSGDAISLSDALVQAAGGLTNFQAAIQSFYEKFFTDAQKQARDFQQLTTAFSATYQVLPTTRAGYAALNTSISDEDAVNQAKLKNFTPAQLTSTTAGLAAQAAADLSAARYKTFFDNVGLAAAYYDLIESGANALKDKISTAFDDLSNILTGTITKMTGFVDGLKKFSYELSIGSLSPSNAAIKANLIRSTFADNVNAIKKGYGTTTADNNAFDNAINSLQTNANNFLNNSMATSTSAAAYANDYNTVQAAIQLGIKQSSDVKTTAQLQLDAAKQQVNGLITLNNSVKDVVTAINNLGNTTDKLKAYNTDINSTYQSAVTTNNANEKQHGIDQNTANTAAVLAQKHTAYDDLAALFSRDKAINTITTYNKTWNESDVASVQNAAHYAAGNMYDFNPNISVEAYQQIKNNVIASLQSRAQAFHGMISSQAFQDIVDSSFASSQKLIKGYAKGGDHSGGLRLVGENGPELEFTGPSRIFSNPQTKSMLDNSELIEEVKKLREEVKLLRQDQRAQSSAVVENGKAAVKQMQRWDIDGIPIKTNDPINVVIT